MNWQFCNRGEGFGTIGDVEDADAEDCEIGYGRGDRDGGGDSFGDYGDTFGYGGKGFGYGEGVHSGSGGRVI